MGPTQVLYKNTFSKNLKRQLSTSFPIQELIHPLMMISKEDHKEGRISEKEFKRRLAFCGKKLREAKLCLR